jgi:thiol-disulfide isomerase/thioredoxin
MKWLVLAALVACKSSDAPPPVKLPHLVFIRAADGDVASVVRSELARTDGKRVVVYVGATWCEPCRYFHDHAVRGALDGALPATRFIEFDLDRDEERLRAAGYESKYIPLFAVPTSDGRASGKQIAGSIKGEGAPGEIAPRLSQLLRDG